MSDFIETDIGRWNPAGLRAIPSGAVVIRQPSPKVPNRVIEIGTTVVGTIRKANVGGKMWIVRIKGHEFRRQPGSMAYESGIRFAQPAGFRTLAEVRKAVQAVLKGRPEISP